MLGSIEALASLFDDDGQKHTFFNMKNRFSGDTPAHTAIRHGWLEVVRSLVEHGTNPLTTNRFGETILDYEEYFEPGEVTSIVDGYKKRLDPHS